MKKIISTLSLVAFLTTTANADFLRVEAGAGVWSQTPSGDFKRKDGDGALSLNGSYTSNENDSSEFYFWSLIKHPIPLLPNVRLEYVSVEDDGVIDGYVNGIDLRGNLGRATITTDQYDVIPYYNILDNTAWITIDLGLDLKYIQIDSDVKEEVIPVGSKTVYSGSDSAFIPLLYARGRVQIPGTGLGLESDVKYITDGDSTVYDIRAKVDWTFDISPAIQPGIEVGYRIQKYDIYEDGGDTTSNLDYSGAYAGVMVRF